MKKTLPLLFFFITFFIFLCSIIYISTIYKFKNSLHPTIIQQKNTIDIITSQATIRSTSGIYKKIWKQSATSFHIGDGYIIALTHATLHPGYISIKITDSRSIKLTVVVSDYSFSINNKPIKLIGRYEDISLFKSNHTNYVIPVGNSDELEIGTELVVIGNSFLKGINIKKGIVSILDLSDKYKILGSQSENEYKYSFLIDCPIVPGDSGSPVLALKNNKYFLVGVVYASSGEYRNIGICFDSNYIKKVVKKIIMNKQTITKGI